MKKFILVCIFIFTILQLCNSKNTSQKFTNVASEVLLNKGQFLEPDDDSNDGIGIFSI